MCLVFSLKLKNFEQLNLYYFLREINFDYDDQSLKYSRDKDLQEKIKENLNLINANNNQNNQKSNNNNANNRISNNLNNLSKKDYLSNLNSNSNNTTNNNHNINYNNQNNNQNNNAHQLNNISQNIQNSSATKNHNTSNSNNSNSKITFNNSNNPSKHGGRANAQGFRPLSDSRLYEMANQYITTDESLEKFQARLKTKYGSLYTANQNYGQGSNLHVIDEARSPVNHTHRENAVMSEVAYINNNNYNSNNRENASSNFGNKNKRTDRLAKNIASNLEYYNFIES